MTMRDPRSTIRDPKRIPRMLSMLRSLWGQYPDLRLGQIVCNAAIAQHQGAGNADPFNVEDDKMEEALARLFHTYQTQATQSSKRVAA